MFKKLVSLLLVIVMSSSALSTNLLATQSRMNEIAASFEYADLEALLGLEQNARDSQSQYLPVEETNEYAEKSIQPPQYSYESEYSISKQSMSKLDTAALTNSQLKELVVQEHERPFGTDENHNPLPLTIEAAMPISAEKAAELRLQMDSASFMIGEETTATPQPVFLQTIVPDKLSTGTKEIIQNNNVSGGASYSPSSTGGVTFVSSTIDSITVQVVIPAGATNGQMQIHCASTGWVQFSGNGNGLPNGSYTFTNLLSNQNYTIYFAYLQNGSWVTMTIGAATQQTSITMVRTDGEHIFFNLEANDIAQFAPGKYTQWISRLDDVYEYYQDLTGYTPYNGDKIEIKSTRENINAWALSGNPILWAREWVPLQVSVINQYGDISFGITHEISHDFDTYKWNFDAEFWANFKMCYALYRNGLTVCRPYGVPNYTNSTIKEYYRNDADESYNHVMATSVYHHDALTYTFLQIKDIIGWEPFQQTFAFFNELAYAQIPTTNLGKLNLFLSKLKDFSGTNVFTVFTTQDRAIYEAQFGGAIEYVTVAPVPQGSGTMKGIVYDNSILTPALTATDLSARMEIMSMEVDPVNRWLNYQIKVFTSGSTWTLSGGKLVYNNPSSLTGASDILALSLSSSTNWEYVSMTFEKNANDTFLLPANRVSLAGKTIMKLVLREKSTNKLYHFEDELPDPTLFDRAKTIAFAPSTGNVDNVFWYLNYTTADGAANNLSASAAQKGLVYNATQIKQTIGKAAFTQAIAYFDSASSADIPGTSLGRLNLFLTKLKEYSGVDVIGLFSPQGKAVYEAQFGGTIEYPNANLLSTQEITDIANYHKSSYMNDSTIYVGSNMIPMYDNQGVLFAFAVPYVTANGQVVSHINVGARRDGLNFYSIEHTPEAFAALDREHQLGNMIQFVPPMGYALLENTANQQNATSSPSISHDNGLHIDKNASLEQNTFYDGFLSEQNRAETEQLLESIQRAKNSTNNVQSGQQANSMVAAPYPVEDIRLYSENYSFNYPNMGGGTTWPLFVPISDANGIGNGSGIPGYYYGGNQAWFNNQRFDIRDWLETNASSLNVIPEILAIPNWVELNYKRDHLITTIPDGTYWYLDHEQYEGTGCGTIAAANIMAYLAIQQPNKYGPLCPYISSSMIEIEDYIRYMREVSWDITPSIFGIPLVSMLKNGIIDYAESMGVEMDNSSFRSYSPNSGDEVYVEETATFVKEALTNNLPVAMLTYWNEHLTFVTINGASQTGNTHWMTITKYYRDAADNRYVAVSTWGERVSLNFRACIPNDGFGRPQFVSIGWE